MKKAQRFGLMFPKSQGKAFRQVLDYSEKQEKAFFAALLLFSGVFVRLILWSLLTLFAAVIKLDNRDFIIKKFWNYIAAFLWYAKSGLYLKLR